MDQYSKKIGIVLLVLCILFGMSGCLSQKSISIEDIENAGYTVTEADNKSLCITDNGADYYFHNSSGKLTFDRVIIKISAISEKSKAKGLEADITIIRDKGKYESFTSNCLSTDELNTYYQRGFELEEELNQ